MSASVSQMSAARYCRHRTARARRRALSDRFLAEGLVDVDVEGRSYLWRGGSAGAALLRANYEQLRNPIFETGLVTEAQFTQDLTQLSDPHFVVRSPTMWAAWGRRSFLCKRGR